MLDVRISGVNFADIWRGLDAFEASLDLRPLAVRIGEFVEQDNAAARREGVNMFGNPMAPLAQVTIDSREGDPSAPPLIPHYDVSRSIEDFTINVSDLGDDAIAITGAWPDTPFINFHQTGYTSRGGNPVPARPIVGVRPSAQDRIAEMLHEWAASKVSGD